MPDIREPLEDERQNTAGYSEIDALKRVAAFRTIPDQSYARLAKASDVRSYGLGDTILASGQDDGSTLFGVVEGTMRRTRGLTVAGDINVQALDAGDLYDLADMFADEPLGDASLSLIAESDCVIISIDTHAVREELEGHHDFALCMLKFMSRELSRLQSDMTDDAGPERRVFRHLLALSHLQNQLCIIDPMPRHADLAEAAGVSARKAAEAVAILMRERILQRAYPNAVIEDVDRLRMLAK